MKLTTKAYGVGYNSGGKHKTAIGARAVSRAPKVYKVWQDMLERCYSAKYQERVVAYRGCTVDPRWHDYQVFAEWYTTQDHYAEKLQLDKDILFEGNRVYGPDTCCLVPQRINSLTTRKNSSVRGDLPVGVSRQPVGGNYMAKFRREGKQVYLGTFKTPEEAFYAYKAAKEAYIIEVVAQYPDLPEKVKEALLAYRVLITD